MTHSEILAMQPGPELDNQLAPLLGYRVEHFIWEYDDLRKPCTIWKTADGKSVNPIPLSSTWGGMGLVVEALKSMGKVVIIKVDGLGVEDGKLYRDLLPPYVVYVGDCGGIRYKEAPHAVAIAARLALEGDHAR